MIEISGLCKSYEGKKVLDNFSCALPERGVVLVEGRSGAGKTTLMNILMGLREPDAGRITGMENRRVTAVFQENRLIENLSVMKNIRLACGRQATDAEIAAQLAAVGLAGEEKTIVSTLSGGMKRRVALVRAVMAPGDVLMLDEPFKGLDDQTKDMAVAYVRGHADGRLVLLVTHDPSEARALNAEKTISIGMEEA